MVQNRHLSHALSDCGFGELRRQLEYKCEMTGARVCVVDRFYPSSKTCSGCGTVQEMPLSQRTFSCACGLVIDRDHNAALNLWRQALPLQSVERPALTAPRGDVKLVLVKQKKVGLYRNVQTL
jgi:putative transposase